MAQKENIVEEALVQIKGLEDIVTENAKGILSATMGNEISSLVKESLKTNTKKARRINEEDEDDLAKDIEDDEDLEALDAEMNLDDLEDDEMDLDDLEDDEMDLDDLEDDEMDLDDLEDNEMGTFSADDFEDDMSTDIRVDGITGDDDTEIDLTDASTDEILKVFKAMKETDGIIVKKTGNTIDLSDSESDVEYKIALGESMKRRNLFENMYEDEDIDMMSGSRASDNDYDEMPGFGDSDYDEFDDRPSGSRVDLDPMDQEIIDNNLFSELAPEEIKAHIDRVIAAGRRSGIDFDDEGEEEFDIPLDTYGNDEDDEDDDEFDMSLGSASSDEDDMMGSGRFRGEYSEGYDEEEDDDTLNEEILYELELGTDMFPDTFDRESNYEKFGIDGENVSDMEKYDTDDDDDYMSIPDLEDDNEEADFEEYERNGLDFEEDIYDDRYGGEEVSDYDDIKEAFKPKGMGMGKPSKFSYKKQSGGFKTKMKRGTRGVGMGKPKFEFKEENTDFKMRPKKSETTEASRTLGAGKFFGKKGLPKPKAAPRHLRTESVENELILLREKNEEYRNALNMFREKLNEVAVFNSNLAYATRLFTEHSTTKQEKINILRRFDGVESLKESKNLYKSIKNELSNKNSGGVVTESIQNKIDKTQYSGSASNLIESKTYENPQFLRMKDLMTKVNNVI